MMMRDYASKSAQNNRVKMLHVQRTASYYPVNFQTNHKMKPVIVNRVIDYVITLTSGNLKKMRRRDFFDKYGDVGRLDPTYRACT
jgi:hypothetical protein